MTMITLGIDELKQLIADAVSAGVSAAMRTEQQPVYPIQAGSFMARKAVALEQLERKRQKKGVSP